MEMGAKARVPGLGEGGLQPGPAVEVARGAEAGEGARCGRRRSRESRCTSSPPRAAALRAVGPDAGETKREGGKEGKKGVSCLVK